MDYLRTGTFGKESGPSAKTGTRSSTTARINSIEKLNMKTLYLDMDGVVADWVAGCALIIGYELPDPNAMYPNEDWAKIREDQHLFAKLPKMALADDLVTLARKFRDELDWELKFLTAVPHGNDMPWTFWDKMQWCQRYYPDIPTMFGPYSRDKWRHCTPGDILVDDRPDNCASWREHGGVSVHVAEYNIAGAIGELGEIFDKEREARKR
jgi:5'(3')-deoxyribonucleotidase